MIDFKTKKHGKIPVLINRNSQSPIMISRNIENKKPVTTTLKEHFSNTNLTLLRFKLPILLHFLRFIKVVHDVEIREENKEGASVTYTRVLHPTGEGTLYVEGNCAV